MRNSDAEFRCSRADAAERLAIARPFDAKLSHARAEGMGVYPKERGRSKRTLDAAMAALERAPNMPPHHLIERWEIVRIFGRRRETADALNRLFFA